MWKVVCYSSCVLQRSWQVFLPGVQAGAWSRSLECSRWQEQQRATHEESKISATDIQVKNTPQYMVAGPMLFYAFPFLSIKCLIDCGLVMFWFANIFRNHLRPFPTTVVRQSLKWKCNKNIFLSILAEMFLFNRIGLLKQSTIFSFDQS